MKKVILAVDDSKEILQTLTYLLESEGYDIRTLADPEKTEDYIEKYNPDLLILDVFMPKRSGFNIVEDFNDKAIHQELPVIFLTGLDDDTEKMVARSSGVIKYITKPFTSEEILHGIKNVLSNCGDGKD